MFKHYYRSEKVRSCHYGSGALIRILHEKFIILVLWSNICGNFGKKGSLNLAE